jgi:hypothetical protein
MLSLNLHLANLFGPSDYINNSPLANRARVVQNLSNAVDCLGINVLSEMWFFGEMRKQFSLACTGVNREKNHVSIDLRSSRLALSLEQAL